MKRFFAVLTFVAIISSVVIVACSLDKTPKQLSLTNEPSPKESLTKQLSELFADEFGGSYLDSEGVLNINIVGDGKGIRSYLKDAQVKYHEVKYTLAHLNNIKKVLGNKMQELHVVSMITDMRNNKVKIFFDQFSEERVKAVKNIIDSPAIEFVQGNWVVELTSR